MTRALVTTALIALLAAPAAAAKGFNGPVQVCGVDRCERIDDTVLETHLERMAFRRPVPTIAPPLAPYVIVRTAPPFEAVIAYVIEGTNAVGWVFDRQPRWVLGDETVLNKIRFTPVRRYTAPPPWLVLVDGRRATRPARFAALLGDLPRAPLPGPGARWTLIHLSWEEPNPWTDWSGNMQLRYAREGGVLARENGWVRLPDDTAAELGLRPFPRDRSIWSVLAVALVALTAAGVWYLRLRGGRAHAGRDPGAAGVAARGADRPSAP
jgi:hypothetical protein